MSIFWGREFAFVFPFYVRKYTIDRWIVVYTVCASVVISPLRQWLDSYAKLVWKCVTRSGILFICNTFCCWLILLSSLYIELALVCCADPGNVHCFGTIFPNLNFVFVSICAARPVHIQSDQYRSWLTVKERRAVGAATKNSAVALSSRNDMISIHQRNARTNEGKTTLISSYSRTVSWMVSCSVLFLWRPLDWRIRHSHLTSTLFHSLIPWWCPRRIRSQRTRLSQLENSAMGTWPIYKYYYTRLVRKMAWYKILIHVLIV